MVTVKKAVTKKDFRQFVDFPNILYADEPLFVPATYSDDLQDWDREKNPAFEYCEAEAFLAYKDGRLVGRIGAILSHKANDKWNTKRVRFSQVDFIDDAEVSEALFGAVEEWARQKGCDQVHGPLGFCDMDREGMLVEGFDCSNQFFTYYNYPYYNVHLERLGYKKDVDWIEYKVFVPSEDSPIRSKLSRVSEYVLRKYNLHTPQIKTRFEYGPYVNKVFDLVNEAYSPLYSVVPLTPKQIKKYTSKFKPFINPDYSCFVLDKDENLIAFAVAAPSISEPLRRSRGRFLPFGWVGILKALCRNNAIDMLLVAVKPEYQGRGVNAVLLDHFYTSCLKNGVEYAETGPMLETNYKVLSQWKSFDKIQNKRRRCYIKDLDVRD